MCVSVLPISGGVFYFGKNDCEEISFLDEVFNIRNGVLCVAELQTKREAENVFVLLLLSFKRRLQKVKVLILLS